ncbi:hypothetical protein F5Y17DRAFT_181624 [Xylariaceae sp. FL0594]|nr:hypothetical protein F5Y17DRAFT_181624 [Xylariaceae sp. FL0594]
MEGGDLPIRSPEGTLPQAKRRKVRKGTRSCWECRRRKIRCVYPSDAAQICINCDLRGTNCVSQEFSDEQGHAPDRRLTQRLGRVEEMLEKLVEKIMPDSYTVGRRASKSDSAGSAAEDSFDESCPFSVGQPPILEVLSSLRDSGKGSAATAGQHAAAAAPTPAPTPCEPTLGPKHVSTGNKVYALFPCQQDIDAIVKASPSTSFIVGFFARYRDLIEERTEKPTCVAHVPPPTSHPMVLAKRLIQLMNSLQHVQPSTPLKLTTREPVNGLMSRIVSEVTLVAQNDDLVGYVEGVETLALISLYHCNAGNLRKSWLTLHRAISVAQLMGIDRWGDKPLKSADPTSDPVTRTKAKPLWFRLTFIDRYLSLLLGLPAGTNDNSFLNEATIDEPTDRLERQHTVVMGAIIKRNSSKGDPAFGATQGIDCDLEAAARSVGCEFWQLPTPESIGDVGPMERMQYATRLMLQMNHHNLLILLHLPYLLRDPKERRWDYSKATCMSSSRQLLRTFLLFRNVNRSTFACRHTGYAALTAAMTLLLGYLDPKMQARDPATVARREDDRALIEGIRDTLQHMANEKGDKLPRDSSSIITRLLPLLSPEIMYGGGAGAGGNGSSSGTSAGLPEGPAIHLEIPFLGTININPFSNNHPGASAGHEAPHSHAHSHSQILSTNANTSNNDNDNNNDLASRTSPNNNKDKEATTTTSTSASTSTPQDIHTQPDNHPTAFTTTPSPYNTNTNTSTNSASDAHTHPTSTAVYPNPNTTFPIHHQQHQQQQQQQQQQEASYMLSIPMDYGNDFSDFHNNGFPPPMMQFEWSQAQLAHPELAADADEWTFQGFDTAYFESLFSSGLHGP